MIKYTIINHNNKSEDFIYFNSINKLYYQKHRQFSFNMKYDDENIMNYT